MSLHRRALDAFLATLLAVPLCVVGAGTAGAAPSAIGANHAAARVCQTPAANHVACGSLVVVGPDGRPKRTATPAGYAPGDLQAAYQLAAAAAAGSGETVAIVDAYDDPNALIDVNTYRSYFGMPLLGSVGGPTFVKVDQNGGTALPKANSNWSEEISLDLDMVSAICPNCNVLLVESESTSFADLATAVDTAAGMSGVVAVSNSYGGPEIDPSTNASIAKAFDHAGIAITASSGDSGYGVQSPASFPTVTAVGGTTLNRAANARGWTETAWSGAGSGCSAYVAQPTWQSSVLTETEQAICADRVVSDVSAVADPNTGVAVYDTYGLGSSAGWLVFGGTSVSSPIIASVYALAGGQPAAATGAEYAYAHTDSLFDVTAGSNGSCPADVTATASGGVAGAQAAGFSSQARSGKVGAGRPGHGGGTTAPNTFLCQAQVGYDGPTGLGTPNGIGAF